MNVGLAIAGSICVAMAFGHATIGLAWVLPRLNEDQLPPTPLGPGSSERMIRVTWHVVTIFALTLGCLLMLLAWLPAVEPLPLLLRSFAAAWLAATVMALWVARRRLRHIGRLPVPVLWLTVAVLLWTASS